MAKIVGRGRNYVRFSPNPGFQLYLGRWRVYWSKHRGFTLEKGAR